MPILTKLFLQPNQVTLAANQVTLVTPRLCFSMDTVVSLSLSLSRSLYNYSCTTPNSPAFPLRVQSRQTVPTYATRSPTQSGVGRAS